MIEDGISSARRTRKIPRVDGVQNARSNPRSFRVARLVILSDSGYVTLDAIQWCADLGISITQLDRNGRILMSSPGLAGDARLRIAQMKALDTPASTDVVRSLISAKLDGQAQVLRDVFSADEAADKISGYSALVSGSADRKGILALEGQAANVYWRAWRNRVHVPFAPKELQYVPNHWYDFKARASLRNPLAQGKSATDPVNALLNYAYAICETEARYACHVIGLDPAIGYGHGHHRGGDALAFDLMEILRPEADRVVLAMMDTGNGIPYSPDGRPAYFKALWFCETSDAICRIMAPLTHMLSETIPAAVANLAGIHAENISRQVSGESIYKLRTPSYVHRASPARLRVVTDAMPAIGLTMQDLVSDEAWARVKPLIPPEPVVARHKTPRTDARACLAGILLHELQGISWRNIPATIGARGEACRIRHAEWKVLGALPAIIAAAR